MYLGGSTEARICPTTWTDSKWRPVSAKRDDAWMVFGLPTRSKHSAMEPKMKKKYATEYSAKAKSLEKLTGFPNRKKYGFYMVFVWIFKKIPFWKKYLFSNVGFPPIPCWDLLFSKGGKYFHRKCGKTWKMHFPTLDLQASTNGISIYQSWNMF